MTNLDIQPKWLVECIRVESNIYIGFQEVDALTLGNISLSVAIGGVIVIYNPSIDINRFCEGGLAYYK